MRPVITMLLLQQSNACTNYEYDYCIRQDAFVIA
jgi:hypothetical protein